MSDVPQNGFREQTTALKSSNLLLFGMTYRMSIGHHRTSPRLMGQTRVHNYQLLLNNL